MKYDLGLNMKALVFGAAIAAGFILLGFQYNDWLYPFSAMLMGALASTPIAILFLEGYFGQPSGFFITENGIMAVVALIVIVGAIVGLVGAWAKVSREKAKIEYEKQQNIGKNKKKKKKAEIQKTNEKTTFVDKVFKK